ncbi:putative ribonuclease H-like domain-containing protein [Tanacetum coccineum]
MTKTTNEQGFISAVYEGKTHEDLHTCLFACFLSQEEPKKVIQALKDPSWIEAMQEELLQFKLQQVWTLVDLPHRKRAIGTKWVYRKKKDERVARIEVIRLFLAYASFKDFVVYQMDVKSAFLYGKIEEEVYVCQPPGFEDPEFPDRVYKVEKALYGLHQAPRACSIYVDDIIFGSTKKELCTEFEKLMHKKFQMSSMGELTFFLGLQVTQKDDGIFISQDKYVDEILKKFGFSTVKTASTPMETSKPLIKDENSKYVDVHLYRSMIGSLMYLTSSRPDIMFAVCACARFQVTPKVSHLYAVKRIFRYLKGQPKLGIWYPKDSQFDLEAYTDSDYAGASLDGKSTTRGCQFLGSRLISWQCKKQTVVANSVTEAEYVAAPREVNYVNMQRIMHKCCLKWNGTATNDEIQVSVVGLTYYYAVTVNPTIYTSCIKQFWATAKAKTVNGEVQIQALVDGKKVIVTETSVRRALQLKDAEVFLDKQVEGMTKHKEIYITPSHTKKVFANMKREGKGFSGRVTPLFQTMMVQDPEELEPITDEAANEEHVHTHSNNPLLSGEDRLKLKELLELCTKLSERVLDLKSTKTSQAAEITKLKERVKKLERRNKSRTQGLKRLRKVGRYAQVISSEDEGLGDQEDASKKERKITDLDADAEEVKVEKVVGTAEVTTVSATTIAVDKLTLAQTLIEIKAAKPEVITTATTTTTTAVTRPKARGVVVQERSELTKIASPSQLSQLPHAKDKGKAKMIEPEKPLKNKDQILIDEEIAQKLQAQLNAELEEEEKLAKQREEDANIAEWDNVQAMIDADY